MGVAFWAGAESLGAFFSDDGFGLFVMSEKGFLGALLLTLVISWKGAIVKVALGLVGMQDQWQTLTGGW